MAGFLLAFLLLVHTFWPAGKLLLQRVLFPFSQAEREAVEVFIQELHNGAHFRDAFGDLYLGVLKNAGLAED